MCALQEPSLFCCGKNIKNRKNKWKFVSITSHVVPITNVFSFIYHRQELYVVLKASDLRKRMRNKWKFVDITYNLVPRQELYVVLKASDLRKRMKNKWKFVDITYNLVPVTNVFSFTRHWQELLKASEKA